MIHLYSDTPDRNDSRQLDTAYSTIRSFARAKVNTYHRGEMQLRDVGDGGNESYSHDQKRSEKSGPFLDGSREIITEENFFPLSVVWPTCLEES
jgi:hypothetical protein